MIPTRKGDPTPKEIVPLELFGGPWVPQAPPNTAQIIVDPCLNGSSKRFTWEISLGEEINLSVEGK